MHLSFGLVDGVTVVNLPYLAAERPAELNKNNIHGMCVASHPTLFCDGSLRETEILHVKSPNPDAEELSRPRG
jgi:hypothetical protein